MNNTPPSGQKLVVLLHVRKYIYMYIKWCGLAFDYEYT